MQDSFADVLVELSVVLVAALAGRRLAQRFAQPAVLGEMAAGAAVALALIGLRFDPSAFAADLHVFAELGLVLLLFAIGLETDVAGLRGAGGRAVVVASVGLLAPVGLVWILLNLFSFGVSPTAAWYLATALGATSVAVTARYFQERGLLASAEARLILAAAVVDDVLGLLALSIVEGQARGEGASLLPVLRTCAFAILFLGLVMWQGERVLAWLLAKLRARRAGLLFPLIICALLAAAAAKLGLATLVGAFAAGLVMPGKTDVRREITPLADLLVPVFFVYGGLQVNFASLTEPRMLMLTLGLLVLAVVGKLLCGLAAGRGLDRWTVGLGMIPRGEVGLVFAASGQALGVLSGGLYSALTVVIFFTTLLTPLALRKREDMRTN